MGVKKTTLIDSVDADSLKGASYEELRFVNQTLDFMKEEEKATKSKVSYQLGRVGGAIKNGLSSLNEYWREKSPRTHYAAKVTAIVGSAAGFVLPMAMGSAAAETPEKQLLLNYPTVLGDPTHSEFDVQSAGHYHNPSGKEFRIGAIWDFVGEPRYTSQAFEMDSNGTEIFHQLSIGHPVGFFSDTDLVTANYNKTTGEIEVGEFNLSTDHYDKLFEYGVEDGYVNEDGNVPSIIHEIDPSTSGHVIYSKDGTPDAGFYIWSKNAAAPSKIPNLKPTDTRDNVAWSPDGQTAAIIGVKDNSPSEPPYGDIFIYNVSTGKITQITHTPTLDEQGIDFSPDGKYLVWGAIDKANLDQRQVYTYEIEKEISGLQTEMNDAGSSSPNRFDDIQWRGDRVMYDTHGKVWVSNVEYSSGTVPGSGDSNSDNAIGGDPLNIGDTLPVIAGMSYPAYLTAVGATGAVGYALLRRRLSNKLKTDLEEAEERRMRRFRSAVPAYLMALLTPRRAKGTSATASLPAFDDDEPAIPTHARTYRRAMEKATSKVEKPESFVATKAIGKIKDSDVTARDTETVLKRRQTPKYLPEVPEGQEYKPRPLSQEIESESDAGETIPDDHTRTRVYKKGGLANGNGNGNGRH